MENFESAKNYNLWKQLANFIKSLVGDVDLTKGDLQTQIDENTLVFKDSTIAVEDFIEDTTYADYSYKADIMCPGVTSDYIPYVNLNMADAIGGNYAPICVSGENMISIYSEEPPKEDVIIPTILCVKGGA